MSPLLKPLKKLAGVYNLSGSKTLGFIDPFLLLPKAQNQDIFSTFPQP